MTGSTQPLTSTDCDLRDFPYMPLDVLRLRDSEISKHASGEEFRCAVLLWCASWHQVPAASLPDDDIMLAQFAGFGRVVKAWKKVRDGALRGWIKCADGRLYHPTVAEKANEAQQAKRIHAHKKLCDRLRKANTPKSEIPSFSDWISGGMSQGIPPETDLKRKEEDDDADKNSDGIPPENTLIGRREEGRRNINTTTTVVVARPRAAKKCPDGFEVSETLEAWARNEVPTINLHAETEKFRDHTFSRAITDWDGAWRNWMRNAREYIKNKSPPGETFREKDARMAAERVAAFAPSIANKSAMHDPIQTIDVFEVTNATRITGS